MKKMYDYAETDIFDKYIRVSKKDAEEFKDGSLKMTDVLPDQGVFAIVGNILGDESLVVQSYLFTKDTWTCESADEWVAKVEQTGQLEEIVDGQSIVIQIKDLLNKLIGDEVTVEGYADLKSLKGVEIFETGKHNGDNYTLDDLKEIEGSFAELKTKLQPYVKLGHNEEQPLLARDGMPAAGWIDKVYIEGNKLLADIIDMPSTIYELVKNKAYKRISSEIYWNLKDSSGKLYKRALKAIALLGGDTPAVGTLADVQALYTKRAVSEMEGEVKTVELRLFTEKEVNQMTEEIKVQAEFEAYKLEAEKKIAEVEAQKLEAEKAYSMLQAEKRASEIESSVNGLIESKKITPAQKDIVVSLYSMQDSLKKYDDSQEDLVTKFFETAEAVIETNEVTEESDKVVEEKQNAEAILNAKSYKEASEAYKKMEAK